MQTKDLQIMMFWVSSFDKTENAYFTRMEPVNKWLSENPDREIERMDYPNAGNNQGCIMVIWHRKIDPDFRNRRGPEA